MRIDIRHELPRLERALADFGKREPAKVLNVTINQTLSDVQSWLGRKIADENDGFVASRAHYIIKRDRSTLRTLIGRIYPDPKRKRTPLSLWKGRKTSAGWLARIRGKESLHRGAFKARMASGYIAIAIRSKEGPKRPRRQTVRVKRRAARLKSEGRSLRQPTWLPITEQTGPAVSTLFVTDEPLIKTRAEQIWPALMDKNLKKAIARLSSR